MSMIRKVPPLDELPLFAADHDGDTYDSARDRVRLNAQQQRIYDLMKDGRARSLREIAAVTGDPESSISARLRDFRKPKFGGFEVEREYVTHGIHTYRLVVR